MLFKFYLGKLVLLVSFGVNDYGFYNVYGIFKELEYVMEMKIIVMMVVDGIVFNFVCLYSFGFCNIIVVNLVLMLCFFYIIV